ncbi:DUF6069 family protein [Embleya scabrispora]|uniref:DUF6069 family protein n=1 Tax=Embleya scabrispora TaxID=159449 RepID=UPI00035E8C29|nr:DUF6069 family protein [Embleya scabrispora]MYS78852.1 hypothetical protein [Streptomyces sp. SID5474]
MNTTQNPISAERAPAGWKSRAVWTVSVAAGAAAAIGTEAYGLLARGLGVPMRAGNIGAATAEPITVGMFAMGTAVSLCLGTILAVLVARFAACPARTYLVTTVALVALSMAGPLLAGDTPASTKAMLCGAHLVAAAIVVPVVTRRLESVAGRGARG